MGNSLCIEDKQPVPIANTLLYSNKNVKSKLKSTIKISSQNIQFYNQI